MNWDPGTTMKPKERGARPRSTRPRGVRPLFPPLVGACLLVVLTPGQAAGYIDPISGSIILQVLAAAALGALLTIRRVWAGLTGICHRFWDGITRRWRQ